MVQALYPYISDNLEIKKYTALDSLLTDYGFMYGYGVFETILITNSKPMLFKEHIQRMKNAAKKLKISLSFAFSKIKNSINELIRTNNVNKARLNLYLTFGDGVSPNSRLLAVINKLPPDNILNKPVKLIIERQKFTRTKLDSIKTMSYLKNIYEKQQSQPYDDVMLMNKKNEILETTSANVFFIKNKTVITPKSNYILPGITRNFVKGFLPELGFEYKEKKVFLGDLDRFDEVFLTSSIRGVVLVKEVRNYLNLQSGKSVNQIRKLFQSEL